MIGSSADAAGRTSPTRETGATLGAGFPYIISHV